MLYEIDVLESHRRRGVGRAIVKRLKCLCAERGYGEMFVLTNTENAAAMALYVATDGRRKSMDDALFVYVTATPRSSRSK